MENAQDLREGRFDQSPGVSPELRKESFVQHLVLNFFDVCDRHDSLNRGREDAERARFAQRAFGFSTNLGPLTGTECRIIGLSHFSSFSSGRRRDIPAALSLLRD
jgi:hypothetical protein